MHRKNTCMWVNTYEKRGELKHVEIINSHL